MKRSNKNPFKVMLESNPPAPPPDPKAAQNNALDNSQTNVDSGFPWGKAYVGSMITGVGSKMIKDIEIVNHIIGKYPNPMDLKARLQKINHISAKMLAARLNEDTSYEEYKALIRKYICKSSFGKYLLHAVMGPISTVVNTLQAIGVPFNTPDDNIGDNL